MNHWKKKLDYALSLPMEYDHRKRGLFLPITGARKAAVLMLIKADDDQRDFSLIFTKRTERVETHKGQIAFPGGMTDPEDLNEGEDRAPIVTALRESEEEVGIPRSRIEVVGALPELYTATRFLVTPIVGILREPAQELPLTLSEHEIDSVFWARRSQLEKAYCLEEHEWNGTQVPIHVFTFEGHRIWGATGAMLRNLLDRLERVDE